MNSPKIWNPKYQECLCEKMGSTLETIRIEFLGLIDFDYIEKTVLREKRNSAYDLQIVTLLIITMVLILDF